MSRAKHKFKNAIKNAVRRFGFDIKRYCPESSEASRFQRLLEHYNVDLILDVGANDGQYGREIRLGGYQGRIVSFEPLAAAYENLLRESQDDDRWYVAPRMALGERDGTVEIHVAGNSRSSSIADMLPAHLQAAPESKYVGTEAVRLAKLDTVANDYIGDSKSVFLKVDTQGYESQVLEGAAKTIKLMRGMQLELSLVPLYKGQRLFRDMLDMVSALGFELHGLSPAFVDESTGRLLQVDGVFFRA
jgi:FkbM family methyltransferase